MSQTFVWALGLLAFLFLFLRRFFRHRSSLTEYQTEQMRELDRIHEVTRHETGGLSDAEALRPALAALEDLTLPCGVTLCLEPVPAQFGGVEVRLTLRREGEQKEKENTPTESVTLENTVGTLEKAVLLTLIVGHTKFRVEAAPHATLDGQWLLRREQDSPELETFVELASFSARLETLIARSLHDFSDNR